MNKSSERDQKEYQIAEKLQQREDLFEELKDYKSGLKTYFTPSKQKNTYINATDNRIKRIEAELAALQEEIRALTA